MQVDFSWVPGATFLPAGTAWRFLNKRLPKVNEPFRRTIGQGPAEAT
jgi:hypothetical protein